LIDLQDGQISLEEYKEWASTRRFSQLFPKLLVQVSVRAKVSMTNIEDTTWQRYKNMNEKEKPHQKLLPIIIYMYLTSSSH